MFHLRRRMKVHHMYRIEGKVINGLSNMPVCGIPVAGPCTIPYSTPIRYEALYFQKLGVSV